MYCSNCGTRRATNDPYCGSCGRRFAARTGTQSRPLIIAGAVAAVVIVVVLFLALPIGRPQVSDRPRPIPSARATAILDVTTPEMAELSYAKLRRSLAMVVAEGPDGVSFGSAFCIASTPKVSYFLTNHHVVGDLDRVHLVFASRKPDLKDGLVASVGAGDTDLAVLATNVGNIPPVRLAKTTAIEGQSIAVAGFPSIQFRLAANGLGLSPSMHVGTVNAMAGNGFYIEYDAQTDHGNSGGPLYDVETGDVYAVVTYGIASNSSQAVQNNLAISIDNAKPLIETAMRHPAEVLASLRSLSPAPLPTSPPLTATPGLDNPGNTDTRFTAADCGSVYDSRTGLTWKLGPNANPTWDEAQSWVASLDQCDGKGWRMPTLSELATLYDPQYASGVGFYQNGVRYPAHISPLFEPIGDGSWGWSDAAEGDTARAFNFNQGVATRYDRASSVYTTRAFAVLAR